MTLESLDGHEDLVTNITVERNGEMIDMYVNERVPPNSLWRASILAYGCESHRIVSSYELSKLETIIILAEYAMDMVTLLLKVPMIFRMLLLSPSFLVRLV